MKNGEGDAKKPKLTMSDVKLPPKRTKAEWREITRMKLRQYEAIGHVIMGKKTWSGGSSNE